MTLNDQAGFTLIELLVVMSIIAILATFASMTYFHFIDRARVTVATSTLNNINKALEVYNLDHGSYPKNISFADCTDDHGQQIFTDNLCLELKRTLQNVDSYTLTIDSYRIRATVNNKAKTPIHAAPGKVFTEEIP